MKNRITTTITMAAFLTLAHLAASQAGAQTNEPPTVGGLNPFSPDGWPQGPLGIEDLGIIDDRPQPGGLNLPLPEWIPGQPLEIIDLGPVVDALSTEPPQPGGLNPALPPGLLDSQRAVVDLGLLQTPAAAPSMTDDGEEEPETTPGTSPPGDFDPPTNGVFRTLQTLPPGVGSGDVPPTSPSPATNFQAAPDNLRFYPPDTQGAVSTNRLVTVLNGTFRIQDRAGNVVTNLTLTNFWGSAWPSRDYFDPRVQYDPYANRWIHLCLSDRNSTNSSILVAASRSTDPHPTNWFRYRINLPLTAATNFLWGDYPNVGFSKTLVAITATMITNVGGTSIVSRLVTLDKTNLYGGNLVGRQFNLPGYGFNQVPAVTYDSNLANLFMVQSGNGALRETNVIGGVTNITVRGLLVAYYLSGAATNPALTVLTNFPSASPWGHMQTNPVNLARQQGLSIGIHVGDARMQNVVYRNGSLWCAHTIMLPYTNGARAAVQWWELSSTGLVRQQGLIDDQNGVYSYAYPSICANRFGDVLIGYSRFATNQYASANYSFRNFYDANSQLNLSYTFKAGEGPYYKQEPADPFRNRWGDFSSTVIDPVNDIDLWTIQEYAATPSGTGQNNFDGRWGTWWAQVAMPLPGNDNFASSYQVSGSSGSTNGTTIRATRESSEPNHAGNTNGGSIWYHWTPPSAGNVIIDTAGSEAVAALGIYTGSSVASLTLVTNDLSSLGNASRVIFNASTTTYRIAVDGRNGSMNDTVLNWQRPTTPVFVTQPQSQTKYVGDSVTFTSLAIGNPAASYQWTLNGTNIAGATSASYTKSNLQTNDSGSYTVIATNSSGSVTSVVAELTMLTKAATLAQPTWTTNNTFQLTVARETNFNYIIQVNTNLNYSNWVSVVTNTAPFTFSDSEATNSPHRFYRAIYQP